MKKSSGKGTSTIHGDTFPVEPRSSSRSFRNDAVAEIVQDLRS